jgi:hypothetical protein
MVFGGHHQGKGLHEFIDDPNHLIASRNRQGSPGAEVILNVHNQ